MKIGWEGAWSWGS